MIVNFEESPAPSGCGGYITKRAAPCFVVLDDGYRIANAEPRLDAFLAGLGLSERPENRLPEPVERAVRHVAAQALAGRREAGGAALAFANLLVRACVLVGPAGACIAVTLEPLRERDPLGSAAVRFRLTQRELEVLALILEGLETSEIAARLGITAHTVGEYFKHLRRKIGATSRAAMLARIFQWPPASS